MTGESTLEFGSDGGCDTGGAHGDHWLEMVCQRSQVVELFSAQFHGGLNKSINVWVTG